MSEQQNLGDRLTVGEAEQIARRVQAHLEAVWWEQGWCRDIMPRVSPALVRLVLNEAEESVQELVREEVGVV